MARRAPPYLANFDSASAMVRALGRFLRGKDFPGLGITPTWLEPVARAINRFSRRTRESIYTWSGWGEALPPEQLGAVDADQAAEWVVSEYPRREYPAVAIGSSSGALVHLCAALGIPWLPQTFLIPVRRSGVHPDEPKQDLHFGQKHARPLLLANPDLQLHQMHDANQDRLMIQRMTYFRVKWLRLAPAYRRFIEENLAPGGTVVMSECELTWPTTQVAPRHIFQQGALGGATKEEFFEGGPRVADYLARCDSYRRQWDPPEPDGKRPEAEWGFEPSLREDVYRLAWHKGYALRRLLFGDPEQLSPLVADLYRRWYRHRGLLANRLLIESFIVMEPWWTLATASVPFWMTFNMEPSAEWVEQYLDEVEPYDEIYLMLFSHGVDSVGLATIDRWCDILRRARRWGRFVGVDESKFPRDFATFIRYYTDLRWQIPARYPIPGPLPIGELERFVAEAGDRYSARWLQEPELAAVR